MSSFVRRMAVAALGVVLLVVAGIVLWPTHPNASWLFGDADRLLTPLVGDGLPGILLHFGALELAANIAMFVPLGFLGTLALPRRGWWVAPVACFALSVTIEMTQLLLLPDRTFSLRDIVGNTLGGLLGTVLAAAARGIAGAVTRRRRSTAVE
ncbi:VanZ family protein [Gryllotalpicola protaetiae]|uniref:VanZ family protein n=1 Tax=Gryllotalpicola protaetiae TaxID=2419771 RepID=A0A387BTB6_9MICO|nr:VanZ family protein [Gryllotalpicola protaetiae]AYG04187.1 VanZ family protein [Gryllotalpicola protaetiae]